MRLPEPATLDRWLRIVVVLAMAWSLLAALAFAAWGGEDLWLHLRSAGPPLVLATIAVFVANHLLRFVRWHFMLRADGHSVSPSRGLSIFLAGLALLPTPGKAGVTIRSLLLLEEGVPVHVSLAAHFGERLLDLVVLLMLASVLIGPMVPGGILVMPVAIGVAGIVAIHAAPRSCRALHPRLGRFPRSRRLVDWSARFFEDAAHMLALRRLPAFLLLGLASNAVTGVLLWVALRDSPAAVALATAVGVVAVSHLSGSLSLSPGGLGGFELAMLGQLAALDVPAPEALAALAAVRIVTLWGSVALGWPLLWLGMRRLRRSPSAGRT